MKRLSILLLLLTFLGCPAAHKPVPVGEIPAPQPVSIDDEQYGHEMLDQLTERYELDYNHPRYSEVERVVDRIAKTIGAGNQPWHLYILKDPSVKNAGATRGNTIFVWSGMLDATRDEAELATILSHEMGHVIAGHTAPDPSEETRRLLINVGAMAAGIAASVATRDPNWSQSASDLASSVTQSIGEGVFLNPYSQDLEYEADHIGLMLMGAAGYNPEKAIEFWTRAQNDPDFSSGVAFLSSHPPAADRLQRLQAALPLAMEYYKKNLRGEKITIGKPRASGSEDDSFDFNKRPRAQDSSSYSSTMGEVASSSEWRVTRDGAILRSKPSKESKALGEFRRGAVLHGVSDQKGWIEIERPDHGYVSTINLEPAS